MPPGGRRRSSTCRNFNGDQLQPARTGGDLSVQACADDPQVAFHAVRELDRLAYGAAQIRWAQTGFLPERAPGETPRNLMGFKDGTNNPPLAGAPKALTREVHVWVGDEGPGLDARRQLYGGAADPHRARALGSHEGRLSGADDRPAQIFRRADRQARENEPLDLDAYRQATAIR